MSTERTQANGCSELLSCPFSGYPTVSGDAEWAKLELASVRIRGYCGRRLQPHVCCCYYSVPVARSPQHPVSSTSAASSSSRGALVELCWNFSLISWPLLLVYVLVSFVSPSDPCMVSVTSGDPRHWRERQEAPSPQLQLHKGRERATRH